MAAATSLTPQELSLRASKAAHIRWANTDKAEASEAATRRLLKRFHDQVPAEVTDPAERDRRAQHLLKAYMADLSFRSSKLRRARKAVS